MQFDNITYEVKGKTAIVTLNRPEKRNALSGRLLRELHEALLEADEYKPGALRRAARCGAAFLCGCRSERVPSGAG